MSMENTRVWHFHSISTSNLCEKNFNKIKLKNFCVINEIIKKKILNSIHDQIMNDFDVATITFIFISSSVSLFPNYGNDKEEF